MCYTPRGRVWRVIGPSWLPEAPFPHSITSAFTEQNREANALGRLEYIGQGTLRERGPVYTTKKKLFSLLGL